MKNLFLCLLLMTAFTAQADLLDQALSNQLDQCTAEALATPDPNNSLGYRLRAHKVLYPVSLVYQNPEHLKKHINQNWNCTGDSREVLNCMLKHAVDSGICKKIDLFIASWTNKLGRCTTFNSNFGPAIDVTDANGESIIRAILMFREYGPAAEYGCFEDVTIQERANCLLQTFLDRKMCGDVNP